MNHGSLFSGIGGFDLAAEWMGWNNIFHCEWNDFGQKVLKYYWPNAISYGDITKTDFSVHRGQINIITGGFPCQPFSAAGKRKGKEDDRYLWPEMLRAIREIQPTWIIGENVGGIISMVQPGSEIEVESQATFFEANNKETILEQEYVIETICSDLEREGYSVQPILIPACGVGAPHRRDRVWFVAHSECSTERQNGDSGFRDIQRTASDSSGIRCNRNKESTEGCDSQRDRVSQHEFNPYCSTGAITDTRLFGQKGAGEQATGTEQCNKRITADTSNQGLQRCEINRGTGEIRTERKQQFIRPLSPTWSNFPTQPPVCSRTNGLSSRLLGITVPKHRNESIKAYGNAIVPQVAYEIFKAIEKLNSQQ